MLTKVYIYFNLVNNSSVGTIIAGRKRRLGFGKRGKNSFTVQRSEEVGPEMRAGMGGVSRASSASSENDEDRFAVLGTDDVDTIVISPGAVAHSRITGPCNEGHRETTERPSALTYLIIMINYKTQHVTVMKQINVQCRLCKSANVELYLVNVLIKWKLS